MQSPLETLNLTAERFDLSFVGDHLFGILIIENANLVSEHSDSPFDLGDIGSLRLKNTLFTLVGLVNPTAIEIKPTTAKTIEKRRATSALSMFLISTAPQGNIIAGPPSPPCSLASDIAEGEVCTRAPSHPCSAAFLSAESKALSGQGLANRLLPPPTFASSPGRQKPTCQL
jgi:hypothetical protein